MKGKIPSKHYAIRYALHGVCELFITTGKEESSDSSDDDAVPDKKKHKKKHKKHTKQVMGIMCCMNRELSLFIAAQESQEKTQTLIMLYTHYTHLYI